MATFKRGNRNINRRISLMSILVSLFIVAIMALVVLGGVSVFSSYTQNDATAGSSYVQNDEIVVVSVPDMLEVIDVDHREGGYLITYESTSGHVQTYVYGCLICPTLIRWQSD